MADKPPMSAAVPTSRPAVPAVAPGIPPMPPAFFDFKVHDMDKAPSVSGLCVGYEGGEWRADQLVDHLMEWLPEFSLKHSEREGLSAATAISLIRQAALTVYKTKKFKNRGEFGELLLHVAIRQGFNSFPAISKLYYKTANNDTVKGFDAVHVVGDPTDMALWLGEAKFYNEIGRAVTDVVKEIKAHCETDYLRAEFMMLKGKIDDQHPHAQALKDLMDHRKSLDEVFKRVVIPVLLTYDSDCVNGFNASSEAYKKAFVAEIAANHDKFSKAGLPEQVEIHLFLMPLKSKADLVAKLDEKLKAWQKI